MLGRSYGNCAPWASSRRCEPGGCGRRRTFTTVLPRSTGCWKRCRDGVVAEAPDSGFPAPSGATLFLESGTAFALRGRGHNASGRPVAGAPESNLGESAGPATGARPPKGLFVFLRVGGVQRAAVQADQSPPTIPGPLGLPLRDRS